MGPKKPEISVPLVLERFSSHTLNTICAPAHRRLPDETIVGNGYYDEKAVQRQRICYKCLSFVTHDKVDDKMLACPLCGNRIESRPTARVARIGAAELARIIAVQVKNRLAKKR